MAALDTNILVRWLTNDDVKQCAAVARLLDATISKGERLFVSVTVMLEVEWVLRARYRHDRQQVTAALDALLDVTELAFQTEPALEQALWLFKQTGSRDFADCLHIALVSQAGQRPLLTFDDRASKIEGGPVFGVINRCAKRFGGEWRQTWRLSLDRPLKRVWSGPANLWF